MIGIEKSPSMRTVYSDFCARTMDGFNYLDEQLSSRFTRLEVFLGTLALFLAYFLGSYLLRAGYNAWRSFSLTMFTINVVSRMPLLSRLLESKFAGIKAEIKKDCDKMFKKPRKHKNTNLPP